MRCSATAIDRGEPIWQTRSTVPMSMPSSSDAVATTALQLAALQPLFRRQPQLARQAAVMREHRVFAQPLGQMVRDALGQPPRVDEHQRRAVLVDQRGDAVVDLLPHLVRRDRPELVLRHFDRQIHRAAMPVVDDRRRCASASGARKRATVSIGLTVADRPMRCGREPPAFTTRSSSRASDSARCAPRLSSTTA